MDQPSRLEIIKAHPLDNYLDAFCASFDLIHEDRNALDTLSDEDLRKLAIRLLSALQILDISLQLPSNGNGNNLVDVLLRLLIAINSDKIGFDFDRFVPLLNAVLTAELDNEIWNRAYNVILESTTPPRSIASPIQQTPRLHNTDSFVNSSEHRNYVDDVLREELGVLYVGVPRFYETFFGGVAELETASEAFFKKCTEGTSPLFGEGWTGWPGDANEKRVLSWFVEFAEKLTLFAEDYKSDLIYQRRPLAQPNKSIQGSTAERKLDVGFMNDPEAGKDSKCHWSHILVPGELKSNPNADIASKAWLDIGRYAREVLAAQSTRRFVLGFTLCGSLMRVWEFDRLEGIASEQFDINDDGLQFVSTILGFLWINKEDLGFDPTIKEAENQCFIEIKQDGRTERLIIDKLVIRSRCIAGRATTCWKAHLQGDPQKPLVIKDSWQCTEQDEEGDMLHEQQSRVRDTNDDIHSNIRKGIDITNAANYPLKHLIFSSSKNSTDDASQNGRHSSNTNRKRPSSQTDSPLPPSKRSRSTPAVEAAQNAPPNRIHRRVILHDYGKPIYRASSRPVLLAALEGCITGHKSLHEAGFLHRDISINNLMINEDKENPSLPWFLIDLDLAIKEIRDGTSGAKLKAGTRAFMAVGVLLDEQHSFMHDLESFFWVLFWICIHYHGPDKKSRINTLFEKWNFMDTAELAGYKKAVIDDERDFLKIAKENFTSYYQPLIRWINKLRRKVFPNDKRWIKANLELYNSMQDILREAREDLEEMDINIEAETSG